MTDLKKISFHSNRLIEHAGFFETRKYGYQYQNFINEKLINEVHYEIEINCKPQNTWNDFVYEINRKQIYINQKEPQLLVEQMLDKSSKVIFPLKIATAKDGTMAEICNHKEIVDRWQSIKGQLGDYYYSETAYKVLNKIQKLIFNKLELEKSLQLDWFFHLYFSPIYIDYPLETPQDYHWKSPIFGNQTVDYLLSQTLKEYYTATNKVIINAKGKSIDERSIAEILNGITYPQAKLQNKPYQAVESEMEIQYKLYDEDRNPFSIIASINTKMDETNTKTQKIGLYHLVDDENFTPESDAKARKARAQFEQFQTMEEEGIIDLSKIFKDKKPSPPKVYVKNENPVQFYIKEEIPNATKKSLFNRLLSLLRKNKK
ncbi:hypothetical protein ACHRVK_11970 [Flavobacterium plurextorum]|uniref:hypothetical protein n=1 Tax=Flavobacterium plurextorum TaxID=1114867 RepID=UPI0037573574